MIKIKVEVIVSFLKNYLIKNNFAGYIFGLSGGVDSAVIAAIMAKYFPHSHLALLMNIDNTINDFEDQKKIIEKYNLIYENINLEEIALLFKKTLSLSNLSYNNLKSRLRMVTLYAKGQDLNYLVLGTANFNEIYTGYFTKYGDNACDIMPLANVLKKDIYAMAKFLEIPQSIIDKPPSAGLFHGQTDETDLKITYQQMDDFFLKLNKDQYITKTMIELHQNTIHKIEKPITILPIGEILKGENE